MLSASRNASGEQAQFAITLAGAVIGDVRLYTFDSANNVAGLGYNVASAHWGKGIATEAAVAVLEAGFREFDLRKVIARAAGDNLASLRVMEKIGMTREALLRRHRLFRGDYIDEVWYSALKDEWLKLKETKL